MKITLAITAASGSLYAKKLIERLSNSVEVETIHLVLSPNAIGVIEHEIGLQWMETLHEKVVVYDNLNLYAPIASGSNCDDVMVIVPCSAGTLARIAHGISDSLITRAADVILKERKKLIIALRETPYSLIHIENMRTATLNGAVILPATPSFYGKPTSIDELTLSVVERIEQQISLDTPRHKWQEKINKTQ